MRQETNYIIIHCSATRPSQHIGFEEINRWHREKGWIGCGYHFIIRRDGVIEDGRPTDAVGAHTRGRNHDSIGICMVGGVNEDNIREWEDNFTGEQWESLKTLVYELHNKYPEADIKGHYHFTDDKKCPSFDVDDWKIIECDWVEGIALPDDDPEEPETKQ